METAIQENNEQFFFMDYMTMDCQLLMMA